MLLTVRTTHRPATELGYLLHKNPARVQSFDLSFGRAVVFYPEATSEACTAALLLDVDSVGDGGATDRLGRTGSRKQPRRGSGHARPLPEEVQQRGREHHIAIELPLPLVDANHHPATVDIGGAQVEGFGDAEACGVTGRQDGAMLERGDAVEKLPYLCWAEHDGQGAWSWAPGSRRRPSTPSGG